MIKTSRFLCTLVLVALAGLSLYAAAGEPRLWLEHDGRWYQVQVGPATQPTTQAALPDVVTIDPPGTFPGTLPAEPVATRPATQPATQATTRPVLADRMPFDQRGARVGVTIARGESKTVENLAPVNIGGSFVETALYDGSVLTLRNIVLPDTPRYGLYVEGRLWQPGYPLVPDRAAATVIVEDVVFGRSLHETPLRSLEGIHLVLRNVTATQGTAAKNNQCLRAHGYITEITGGTFGWSIFGPQTDAKNPVNCRTKLVSIKGAKFTDGIRFTKGIEQIILDGCEIDLGANWLNKHTGGHVQDVRTQVLIRNTTIRGPPEKIDFGNSDVTYENSTINGKPAK